MSKARILIVEDSIIVSIHLQSTLENEGYRVVGKCDFAEQALEHIEKDRPDLVLMDIMLAGKMDGIEAAGIIKQKYALPVIYITALTDKDTIQRAKVTEPYGYLTKPFEDREIFTVIEMALYKHTIELKLRQSEEKYFSTVNSISDSVIVIDRNYCITYMNPSAEAVIQCTAKEALGKPIVDILQLRDMMTGEFPVNPIQCPLAGVNLNTMPENLVLIGKHGNEQPIGESSLSPMLDNKENFIGLIVVFKDLTEKKEYERLVKDLEKHRMAALLEGQEKERSRIAKDLHDGLGQTLNAIKMNANVIVKDHKEASNLYQLIDEAIQESVRISENLLPAKLKDFDLATCLRSLCNQVDRTAEAHVYFVNTGDRREIKQPQKINFYRIAQEALNNAVKHSSAHQITLQLNEEPDFIRLTVEDDGRGLSRQNNLDLYKNNGMVNIRERAEIMGGSLTIESDTNRGTLLIVEVPLTVNAR
ncbi:response regulator [Chryseolinea lacunae]|uniref:histidine kinase n=1 Tax=Chryseolinea lacunae TaxID=2801331 RepID=A0ABS1KPC8_9BACT|nr:response regulator [Chryseolinea lacunae]MBL0741107.1 response regulator [Chryseolinea lacunae]